MIKEKFDKILIVCIIIFICGCSNINNDIEEKECVVKENINYSLYFKNLSKEINDIKEIQPICNTTCICDPNYGSPIIEYEGCYNTFENILWANANEKEYKLNVYDCEEFADNGVKKINNVGWKSKSVVVKNNCDRIDLFDPITCNGLHKIIEVEKLYIEATSGKIIHPDDYKDYGINRIR